MREGRRDVVIQESRRFFSAHGNDSAVRQARALGDAIGFGTEFLEMHLEKKNVKGAARAAQEAASGGDRRGEDTNKGYNEMFDEIEATNDLAGFARELPEMLEKEGWADLSPADAQKRIDQYYESQLAGINPESTYGKLVATGILKQNKVLLDAHAQVQAEKGQQERRIMIGDATRAEYELTGTLDHEKLMKRLHTMVPGPGGRMAYLESVFDLAEQTGNVDIIDSIPDSFPGGDPTGKTDPNFDHLFNEAKSKAHATAVANQKAADDAWKTKNQTTLANLHAVDTKMAENGDGRVLANIASGGERGPDGTPKRYTEGQQKTLYDKYYDAIEKGEDNRVILRDWMNGDGIGYSQAEVDAAHVEFVGLMQENVPESVQAAGEEAVNDWITAVSLERGVVNGKLPSVYKDQLKVNLSNPEKFVQAAEMYAMLEAKSPGFAETQINSAKQSAKLYAYNRYLADTGGNEQKALELMGNHEAGRNGRYNKEIGEVNKTTMDTLVSLKPALTSDYPTTARLMRLIDEETRFYVDMGFEPEIAGEYAAEHITHRMRRAGDHIYAADAGWGNEPQGVYDFAIENEAAHRGVDADQLQLIPTADPKRVRFVQEGATLPETTTYPITFFTDLHAQKSNADRNQREAAYEASSADKIKAAEERAYNRRFPPNPYMEPGQRQTIEKITKERWAEMDPEQKQRLIEDEIINME
jgi:hypothetical protein